MLYTKYESSGPCSFGQEEFWKLHFENLFFDPVTYFATNWNGLNNFDRGPPRNHSCEVWSKSNKRFQRRCCLKKLLTQRRTHGRTMDDGQWAIIKAHLKHFVLRWAKMHFKNLFFDPVTYLYNQSEPFEQFSYRGPPRDHSCPVWLNSHYLFKRRIRSFKLFLI